jgi:hypothetical protein
MEKLQNEGIITCAFHHKLQGDQIKKDGMGDTYRIHGEFRNV